MPDAIEVFNEGVARFQENDLGLALEAFDRALQLDSTLAVAYNGRAIVHALNGDMDHAVADSTQALQLAPFEAKFYRTRGLIYRELGDFESAESDLTKAGHLGYKKRKNSSPWK